jgi:hypothetical protein
LSSAHIDLNACSWVWLSSEHPSKESREPASMFQLMMVDCAAADGWRVTGGGWAGGPRLPAVQPARG